jgi:hypothetical protein
MKGMAKKGIYSYTYNASYGYYGYSNIALVVVRAIWEIKEYQAILLREL